MHQLYNYNTRDGIVRVYTNNIDSIQAMSVARIDRYTQRLRLTFAQEGEPNPNLFRLTETILYESNDSAVGQKSIKILLYLPVDEKGVFCPHKIALYEIAEYLLKLGK